MLGYKHDMPSSSKYNITSTWHLDFFLIYYPPSIRVIDTFKSTINKSKSADKNPWAIKNSTFFEGDHEVQYNHVIGLNLTLSTIHSGSALPAGSTVFKKKVNFH